MTEVATTARGSTSRVDEGVDSLGPRATRKREAILDAARGLFLARGYVGTRISDITDACGSSRASFYTYFRDKRAVFDVLGRAAHRDALEVLGLLEQMSTPWTRAGLEDWIRKYFAYLDVHGAFSLSAQAIPADADVRAAGNRMATRACYVLGMSLRARQRTPTGAPEALGLAVHSMLDRSWFQLYVNEIEIAYDDVVSNTAVIMQSVIDA